MPKKKDNTDEILQQLFEDGYATKEIDLIPGKLTALVRNVSAPDQIEVEKEMVEVGSAGAHVVHTYSYKMVAAVLLRYGNHEFANRKEAMDFLESVRPAGALIDKITKLHNLFEKEVRSALKMEEIDKVFFDQASLPTERKPSQKESTQESAAA